MAASHTVLGRRYTALAAALLLTGALLIATGLHIQTKGGPR